MSKLDRQIALKLQSISLRQQRMLRHRREMHDYFLDYCRQPSTLFKAALSGFVLALLIPPGRVRPQTDKRTTPTSFIVGELAKLLPLLLFYGVRGMLNGSSGAASALPQNPE